MKYHEVGRKSSHQSSGFYNLKTDMFSVHVDPLDQGTYKGDHEIVTLGSLSIAKIHTSAAIISRKHEEILNPDFKRYSFIVVLDGEMLLSHQLGTAELKSGQFLFVDNNSPRTMFVHKSISILIISVPGVVLKRHFAVPERFEGMVLNSTRPGQQDEPVFSMILDSWDKLKSGSLREFAPLISEKLLRRLAEVYAAHVNHQHSSKAERISAAKALIEERLFSSDLTIGGLATEIGISSRYLRSLFSHTEKISHYIMRRRLEECALLLSSESNSGSSIREIALNCGFHNIAHFCRIFKRVYKLTPREYRCLNHDRSGKQIES